MGSFILGVVLISIFSFAFAGIPCIVWIILLEMAGLQDFMYALTFMIFTIINLLLFICLKFVNENVVFSILETIVLIGFIIAAFFITPHSLFINIIYKSLIMRILAMISIPLIIMNLLSIFELAITDDFAVLPITLFCSLIVFLISLGFSSIVIWVSEFNNHDDIGYTIQHSWFVYDNDKYDEIRKDGKYKSQYDFLNKDFGTTLDSLKKTCDMNQKDCFEKIKENLYRESNLEEYGLVITDKEWQNDDIAILCIYDRKTKGHKMYKLNYRDYKLEKSSDKEFEELRRNNN